MGGNLSRLRFPSFCPFPGGDSSKMGRSVSIEYIAGSKQNEDEPYDMNDNDYSSYDISSLSDDEVVYEVKSYRVKSASSVRVSVLDE